MQSRESYEEEDGSVLEQSLSAGDHAEKGSTVTITIGEAPSDDYSY